MSTIETKPEQVHLQEITAASTQSTLAQARQLLLEYGRFVLAQPGAGHFCFGSLEKEAADLPFSFLEQGGGSLVAFAQDLPAGFVAWRALPAAVAPNACEMKRLWVRSASRGLSLGRTLALAVMERARTRGYVSIYLDTAPDSMAAAHRLYLDLGFEPCTQYNGNPVEGIAYLSRKL
jgi:putative acetyltransferase